MLSPDDIAKMPTEERLERLHRSIDPLAQAVSGQPEALLVRRPDAKAWAPVEVLCHLRDTEEFFMVRFQTIQASDDPSLPAVDPDRWAEERQYLRSDVGRSLTALRRRREESLAHLRGLDPAGWDRAGIHPTRGRMAIGDMVALMVWHDANHLEQLRRALRGEP